MNDMMEFPDVTRVEVIDDHGRSYMSFGTHDVKISIQDSGRTLKVFLQSDDVSFEELTRGEK